jgi:nucleoside-diphosphate-sugar epimerase
MKVLVIGGTGLISTSIVNQLASRGDDVTVFNRGITEKRIPGSVKVITGDRWKYAEFEDRMKDFSFDAVIDMVAFDPENAKSVLRAFAGRTSQIVVCSTVCVYGGTLTGLPARDDEPHRFVSDYGRNKSMIESILLDAGGKNGLSVTVLRPSQTTGEGAVANGILFDDTLVDRIRKGLPVIVHDSGNTKWAIAHASDTASGFVNSLGNTKAFGKAYHLTSSEHTTWDGVYRELAKAAGASLPDIVHIPSDWLYSAAPRRSVGVKYIYRYDSIFDNSKAEKDLNFKTTVPLAETFRRQIRWMEEKKSRIPDALSDRFEDILIDSYKSGVNPPEEGWTDFNTWGNGTTN